MLEKMNNWQCFIYENKRKENGNKKGVFTCQIHLTYSVSGQIKDLLQINLTISKKIFILFFTFRLHLQMYFILFLLMID